MFTEASRRQRGREVPRIARCAEALQPRHADQCAFSHLVSLHVFLPQGISRVETDVFLPCFGRSLLVCPKTDSDLLTESFDAIDSFFPVSFIHQLYGSSIERIAFKMMNCVFKMMNCVFKTAVYNLRRQQGQRGPLCDGQFDLKMKRFF